MRWPSACIFSEAECFLDSKNAPLLFFGTWAPQCLSEGTELVRKSHSAQTFWSRQLFLTLSHKLECLGVGF